MLQSESSMSNGRIQRQNQQIRVQNAEESDDSEIRENRNEDDVSSIEITEDGLSANVMLMLRQDDGNSTQASGRDMLKPTKKEDLNCSASIFSLDSSNSVELRNFDIDEEETVEAKEACKYPSGLETVEETEEDLCE